LFRPFLLYAGFCHLELLVYPELFGGKKTFRVGGFCYVCKGKNLQFFLVNFLVIPQGKIFCYFK
ncbi:hypothetical protein, partial [Staphylococcus aureus]|uniref:hypothetical protein n=1 Tax=Staphylococcus aureus TaxID=1280 RepID=UPI00210B3F7A